MRSIATELLIKFSRVGLRELDQRLPDAWAKESYAIAVKIAYENGNLRGTPRDRLGIAATITVRIVPGNNYTLM